MFFFLLTRFLCEQPKKKCKQSIWFEPNNKPIQTKPITVLNISIVFISFLHFALTVISSYSSFLSFLSQFIRCFIQAAVRVNDSAGKINQLREEQEECEAKLEKERDIWAAEMFELIAEEDVMANHVINYIKYQQLYYKSALEEIEDVMNRINGLISEYQFFLFVFLKKKNIAMIHLTRIKNEKKKMFQNEKLFFFGFLRFAEGNNRKVFKVPLEEHLNTTERTISYVIELCVCCLLEKGLFEEGLLRVGCGMCLLISAFLFILFLTSYD